MHAAVEVVILDVRDVDAALAFYTEKAGFELDVDYTPAAGFRVVQVTPPGSACSVQFGAGLPGAVGGAPPRVTYLVVKDLGGACRELEGRGVDVRGIRHKSPVDTWRGAMEPGVDPDHRDYASFAEFSDPDGNVWVLQERGFRAAPGDEPGAGQRRI